MKWITRDGVLHGEFEVSDDLGDLHQLVCSACASRFDSVVLHLNEVSFLDSDGIEALASQCKTVTDRGARMAIRTDRPSLRRLLLAGPLARAVDADPDDEPGPGQTHTCPHR